MFRTVTIAFFIGSFLLLSGAAEALVTVHPLESPNKEFKIEIGIGPIDQTSARVYYKGKKMLELHGLGFQLDNGEFIPTPLISKEFIGRTRTREEKINVIKRVSGGPVLPSTRVVRNAEEPSLNYNESVVEYIGLMKIIFRAYDSRIEFCYEFETKANEPIKIKQELTTFVFDGDYLTRAPYAPPAQSDEKIKKVPMSEIPKEGCYCPLFVVLPDGPTLALIGSMDFPTFPLMRFQPGEQQNSVTVLYDHEVVIRGTGKPYRSPWRSINLGAFSP